MVKGVTTSIITVAVLMGSLVACGESGNDNKSDSAEMEEQTDGSVNDVSGNDNKSDSAEMEEQIDGPQKIAFSELFGDIFMMDVDVTRVRRITNEHWNDSPSWSADGSQIVFSSDRDGDWEIFVMDERGKNVRQLTNNDDYDGVPHWSADGSQIVFSSDRDGDSGIFVMDADGVNVRQITSSEHVSSPSFSPDGKQIAFFSMSPNYKYGTDMIWDEDVYSNIFVVDADGMNVQQLTGFSSCFADSPMWSPDGKQIVFSRICFEGQGDAQDERSDILVMDADGANLTTATENGSYPVWTSDGRQIAFTSYRYGEAEIFLMDADGSNVISTTVKGVVSDYWP